MNEQYQKWERLAPLGLTIIGFGMSVTATAATKRAKGERWFLLGTIGLCILNSGIAIFGEAVKCRAVYEIEETNGV